MSTLPPTFTAAVARSAGLRPNSRHAAAATNDPSAASVIDTIRMFVTFAISGSSQSMPAGRQVSVSSTRRRIDDAHREDPGTPYRELIARVEGGEEITISRNGRPAARLVPIERRTTPRAPGALKGQFWMSPDFDDFTAQDDADWYGGE